MMLAEFTPADRVGTLRSQLHWVSDWLDERDAPTLEAVDAAGRIELLTALDDQAFGSHKWESLPAGNPALFAVLKPLTLAG
jgi:hypothetical protein